MYYYIHDIPICKYVKIYVYISIVIIVFIYENINLLILAGVAYK